jgi:hypothetical protein
MRIGHLQRNSDHSGVSGCGRVAEVVLFSDGAVAVHWLSEHPSTVIYNDLDAVIHVHGHNGATQVVWDVEEIYPAEYGA